MGNNAIIMIIHIKNKLLNNIINHGQNESKYDVNIKSKYLFMLTSEVRMQWIHKSILEQT